MRRFFSKEKSRKEKKADFYILYTIVFAVISLFIYGCFYFNGKSLIWSHDGVPQHINALAYYGKYLRNVLKTLVIDHKIFFPMWDMHIGFGSDILTTLHYYVIGDPLTLLSVFVPEKNTEILYEILIFLRIYLAGITFSIYCFYRKNPKQATFIGNVKFLFLLYDQYLHGAVCGISVFRFIPETFRERCISVVPEIYRFLSGGTDDRCDDFFACGDDFVWNRTFSGTELCPVIL